MTIDFNVIINNYINTTINSFAFDILKVETLDIWDNGLVFVAE